MKESLLKILLIEDNDQLREATMAFLSQEGHDVVGVPMAEELADTTGGFIPDVYIIDINLPDEDGLSLTRRLRVTHPQAGIVITTARTQIGDKVAGYESGADLYLTKPVHPRELIASVAALGKRTRMRDTAEERNLVLQLSRLRLVGPAGDLEVTPDEAKVLSALARAPGRTLERWQIAELVSPDHEQTPSSSMIEMRIARLRKKLVAVGAPQPCLKAVHKVGYVLCCAMTLK